MKGGLALGSEHTIQYVDAVLQNCTPENCIILLTNFNSINSVKKEKCLAFLVAASGMSV